MGSTAEMDGNPVSDFFFWLLVYAHFWSPLGCVYPQYSIAPRMTRNVESAHRQPMISQ